MTQADMEAQLAALRSEVARLSARETGRAKARKLNLTIVRIAVIVLVAAAAGLLVQAWTAGHGALPALQLLLLNIPLICLGNVLRTDGDAMKR